MRDRKIYFSIFRDSNQAGACGCAFSNIFTTRTRGENKEATR
jgi:hypothetical protein